MAGSLASSSSPCLDFLDFASVLLLVITLVSCNEMSHGIPWGSQLQPRSPKMLGPWDPKTKAMPTVSRKGLALPAKSPLAIHSRKGRFVAWCFYSGLFLLVSTHFLRYILRCATLAQTA